MKDVYLVLNYDEQPTRPAKLFCKGTAGLERKNNDATKFIVHCECENCECLDWVQGEKTFLSHSEILIELEKPEWNE